MNSAKPAQKSVTPKSTAQKPEAQKPVAPLAQKSMPQKTANPPAIPPRPNKNILQPTPTIAPTQVRSKYTFAADDKSRIEELMTLATAVLNNQMYIQNRNPQAVIYTRAELLDRIKNDVLGSKPPTSFNESQYQIFKDELHSHFNNINRIRINPKVLGDPQKKTDVWFYDKKIDTLATQALLMQTGLRSMAREIQMLEQRGQLFHQDKGLQLHIQNLKSKYELMKTHANRVHAVRSEKIKRFEAYNSAEIADASDHYSAYTRIRDEYARSLFQSEKQVTIHELKSQIEQLRKQASQLSSPTKETMMKKLDAFKIYQQQFITSLDKSSFFEGTSEKLERMKKNYSEYMTKFNALNTEMDYLKTQQSKSPSQQVSQAANPSSNAVSVNPSAKMQAVASSYAGHQKTGDELASEVNQLRSLFSDTPQYKTTKAQTTPTVQMKGPMTQEKWKASIQYINAQITESIPKYKNVRFTEQNPNQHTLVSANNQFLQRNYNKSAESVNIKMSNPPDDQYIHLLFDTHKDLEVLSMVGCDDRAHVDTLMKLYQASLLAGRNETTFILGPKDKEKLEGYGPFKAFKKMIDGGFDFKKYCQKLEKDGTPYKLGTPIDIDLGPKPKPPTPEPDPLKLSGTSKKGKPGAK